MSEARKRLRLVLGAFADPALNQPLASDPSMLDLDRHLGFLYDRAYSQGRGMRRERRGGLGASALTPPDWLAHVRDLFPKECLEIVERDALQKFGMTELLRDPKTLESIEPSEEMLKLLVQFRSQIPTEAREQARRIVEKVVRDLYQKLSVSVRPALTGALDRTRRSRLKIASNLDPWGTVRANLKNYDPQTSTLGIQQLRFHARKRRHASWKVILLVDQSGSMLDSVVYSAIMGAIFASVPEIEFHLVAFDTQVVDMTEIAHDPVEVLFSVQLGGGTLIQRAVGYASKLVRQPRNTIVVVLSDFYEGGPPEPLYARVKELIDGGVKVLGLAALGSDGSPDFDRQIAKQLVALGMPVAAMTPAHLAEWIAKHVRGAA
ncbi:MAG: VWA domain-containing protein [Deltaproteobacteria bacterium]|nr:VWA domain-containing protein [Deltaproteobacteria bacterium]